MAFTRTRPAVTVPCPPIDPLDPPWLGADRSCGAPAGNWPSDLSSWNRDPSKDCELIIAALRGRYRDIVGASKWSPSFVLTRWGVAHALVNTREFYEGIADYTSITAIVHEACVQRGGADVRLLRDLAALIVGSKSGGYTSTPGSYRATPGFVRSNLGEYRDTYPPSDIASGVELMFETLAGAENRVSPLTGAAWLHVQTSIIHPFANGNGRIARLLASVALLSRGWPPIGYAREDSSLIYRLYSEHCPGAADLRATAFTRAFGSMHQRGIASLLDARPVHELG